MLLEGRSDPTTYIDTIEWYNPTSDSKVVGNLPSSAFISDAAVIGNKVYLVVGSTAEATYSGTNFMWPILARSPKWRGEDHSMVLKDDGSLWTMGRNIRDNWGMAPPPTDPRQSRLWMKM